MAVITLSETEVAKFAGVLEWEMDASGLSREAIATKANVGHVSTLSQIKKNPDLLKIARVFKTLGRLEMERELRQAG